MSATADWQHRKFGLTGLDVPALGFGAGHIGDPAMPEDAVGALLNGAVDEGVRLIDTARGYGLSEERIGRHLAWRRADVVLSTKVGYDVAGTEDWTYECVVRGVDVALGRLQTDWIDIVHLHSCPLATLERGDVIQALDEAVVAGKVRVAAYSGDNAELDWAAGSGRFGSLQTSLNLFDQKVVDNGLAVALERGVGVIAKRPVANAPWRFAERPVGDYCEPYWERMQAMRLDPGGLEWQELALRFAAYLPGVGSCIVGTRSLSHLQRNVELVARGPLSNSVAGEIRDAFLKNDDGWTGQT